MSQPQPIRNIPRHSTRRKTAILLLLCGWIFFGLEEKYFQDLINSFYAELFAIFDYQEFVTTPPDQTQNLWQRFGARLSLFTFGLIFCFGIILLIQLHIQRISYTKLSIVLLLALSVFSLVINQIGNSFHVELFRIVAYQVMSLVISPMPVVLLISSYYLHFIPARANDSTKNHFEEIPNSSNIHH